MENSENLEVEKKSDLELGGGRDQLGGQAGIVSNFLSSTNNTVIFYTPFLSEEIAENVNENVLYPSEGFELKNVRDSVNSDRIKKNIVIEFAEKSSGRLILSDKLKGFGPYFRGEVEKNLDKIDQNVDRVFVSGFHDADGNKIAKFTKAKRQLRQIDSTVHLEYVNTDRDTAELMTETVIPSADSLGTDLEELEELCEVLDIELENDSLGAVFQACKELLEELNIDRIHVHTFNFQVCVATDNYEIEAERMEKSLRFGAFSGFLLADKGSLPTIDDYKTREDSEIKGIDDLKHFGDHLNLEDFEYEGFCVIDGYKVAAVPNLVHPDPERLVGLGDVVSSSAFVSETD